jgi:hypothetical protein
MFLNEAAVNTRLKLSAGAAHRSEKVHLIVAAPARSSAIR